MITVRGLHLPPPDATREALSFELGSSEITGLLDPHGARSSALLRALAGLEAVSAEALTVDDLDALRAPAAVRAAVGYLGPDLDACLGDTAREDLSLLATLRAVDPAVVDGVLELMELTAVADRPFHSLSRAQRLRLGLARTLLHDPSVLLLDEPFAHLDPLGRDDLCDQLAELARMGKTVLVHTQCAERLDGLCHRILTLDASGLRASTVSEAP